MLKGSAVRNIEGTHGTPGAKIPPGAAGSTALPAPVSVRRQRAAV